MRHLLLLLALASMCLTVYGAPAQPSTTIVFAAGNDTITMPVLPPKVQSNLTAYMQNRAGVLKKSGYDASTICSGSVIRITIPCSSVFDPCEDQLSKHGSKTLENLAELLNHEPDGRYLVIVAVYADNTGDNTYSNTLTAARADAITQYLRKQQSHAIGVNGYGMGASSFLNKNASSQERAQNRRVEILLVPTESTLDLARQKRL